MPKYLGRNIEPAFAAKAKWDPYDANFRISVRQNTCWQPNLENSALTANNASNKARLILLEPTVFHSTPRTCGYEHVINLK